jgi:hypothetical protein
LFGIAELGWLRTRGHLRIVMTTDELSQRMRVAFPIEPRPRRFWIDGVALPSIDIAEELASFGYVDWPLECVLPAGRKRRTAGKWWQHFYAGFSKARKDAVRVYLTGVRSMLDESIHPTELHHIDEAVYMVVR